MYFLKCSLINWIAFSGPLPVRILNSVSDSAGEIFLKWEPSRNSTQDSYRVSSRNYFLFLKINDSYSVVADSISPDCSNPFQLYQIDLNGNF